MPLGTPQPAPVWPPRPSLPCSLPGHTHCSPPSCPAGLWATWCARPSAGERSRERGGGWQIWLAGCPGAVPAAARLTGCQLAPVLGPLLCSVPGRGTRQDPVWAAGRCVGLRAAVSAAGQCRARGASLAWQPGQQFPSRVLGAGAVRLRPEHLALPACPAPPPLSWVGAVGGDSPAWQGTTQQADGGVCSWPPTEGNWNSRRCLYGFGAT